ncbi:E2 ubiquitin-conjugating enzyme [Malassezia sp. CBS 17886]|nr:E2 ubiquitin-conjugating enzyme [Malassezia sp. CBS 17886]
MSAAPPATRGSAKRLLHELAAAQRRETRADDLVCDLRPADDDAADITQWAARIRGAPGGNYGGGEFLLHIAVPATYPMKPPVIHFRTRIFHPNVHWKTGEICLDVLQSQWSPAWTLHSACTAILALLDAPEPDSPLNVDAAVLFRTSDAVAYRSLCQMYTVLYAGGGEGAT